MDQGVDEMGPESRTCGLFVSSGYDFEKNHELTNKHLFERLWLFLTESLLALTIFRYVPSSLSYTPFLGLSSITPITLFNSLVNGSLGVLLSLVPLSRLIELRSGC